MIALFKKNKIKHKTMNNCLYCHNKPSGLEDVPRHIIHAIGLRCKAGQLIRYKRPVNENDKVFGYLKECKKYEGNKTK